jgi:aubergine-like protein
MAGRARGRGRAKPQSEPAVSAPGPAPPAQESAAPRPVGRARGRGASAASAAAPPAAAPAPGPPAQDGNGPVAPRAAAANGMNRNRGGGETGGNGLNGLERRVGAMQVAEGEEGAGDRRPRFVNDENVSSGNFDGFKIQTDTIIGDRVPLITNSISLYHKDRFSDAPGQFYHVGFLPEVDNRRVRTAMVRSKNELLGGPHILYDGGSALFTNKRIGNGDGIEFDVTREHDSVVVHVTLTHKGQIFVGGGEFNRITGILMKRALEKMGLTQLGRHHFYPDKKIQLNDGYELWPGFITGVNQYDAGLLMVLDTTFKLAHQRSVMASITDLYNRIRPRNDVENQKFQREVLTALVGKIVVTKYNMKRYKIDDIEFNENPLSTFERKTGPITYKQYYKETHDADITDDKQPLLISLPKASDVRRGMTQPILLIPELCCITGISDELRANFRFMLEMGKITRQPPIEKANTMMSLVQGFKSTPEVAESFKFWNMELDQAGLVQLNGVKMHPAELHFKQGKCDYNTATADFQGALRNVQFRVPINVENYVVIYAGQNEANARKLKDGLEKAGRGFGMQFGNCNAIKLESTRLEELLSKLREATASGNLQLAIVVLPDNRADRYNAIKKQCYVDSPVPSQCVLNRTLGNEKGFMSVVSKLALQINVKMGGEPWNIKLPVGPGNMVIGMDVHHVGKGGKGPSQLGFVSSLNKDLTRFYSRVYTNNDEMVSCIKAAFVSGMQKFREFNQNRFPTAVYIFRDGVGEGQLSRVQEEELSAIEGALKEMEATSNICFCVVSKRIMQRFFAVRGKDLANPPPGTVVYDTVTKKDRYDFFLIPQSSRQGTVTPTHYNVLFDNTGLEHGKLMALAFSLCHMYYNWTGSIRVPNVCQYAHKLAFLAGTSLGGGQPDERLATTLYYL